MSRRQKDLLRTLSEAERISLSRLSRSQSAPTAQVARARALLAVAEGLRADQEDARHPRPFIFSTIVCSFQVRER